jgi:hypothetical protein
MTPRPFSNPFFIKNLVESCRRAGVALIANGTGVHAIPPAPLDNHPGLLILVRRHRDEVMLYLDTLVE